MTRNSLTHLVVVSLLLLAGSTQCIASSLTWTAPAGGNWNNAGNWTAGGPPDSLDDTVTFSTIGSGSVNTNDIANLAITRLTVSGNNTHTTDLDGNTLTLNSLSVSAPVNNETASLVFTNSGTLIVTNSLSVGKATLAANGESAVMRLDSGVGLQIGQDTGKRGVLYVGDVNDYACTASLTAGRNFNAYLTSLIVGRRTVYDDSILIGTLDLSAVTNDAILDISGDVKIGTGRRARGNVTLSDAIDLRIGTASSRGGQFHIGASVSYEIIVMQSSLLKLGSGRLDAYVTELRVGYMAGLYGILNATNCSGGVLDVSGDVLIGYADTTANITAGDVRLKNIDVSIGKEGAESDLMVVGSGNQAPSVFTVAGGTFDAHIEQFRMSVLERYDANATVDLSGVTNGHLSISSKLHMGTYRAATTTLSLGTNFVTTIGSESARAEVLVAAGSRPGACTLTSGGSFSAYVTNLLIGTNSYTGAAPTGSAVGTINLSSVTGGTLISATGNVILGGGTAGRGTLSLNVPGTSGGLDLGASATLTVMTNSSINITFQDVVSATGVYWGLRWAGDHVAELTTLNGYGRLTWNATLLTSVTTPVAIIRDDTYTYVGVPVPKRGSIISIL